MKRMILRRCSLRGSLYVVVMQEIRTRNLDTRAWTYNCFLRHLLPFDGNVSKLLIVLHRESERPH
uniref:Uncharacterized protein n=1 Tax=Arundo donax TaxID=35708 RepID=A0A0A9E6K7_ARUDO